MRVFISVCAIAVSFVLFGQQPDAGAKFEIADVHPSAKGFNQFGRGGPGRGARFEMKTASMVDLIRTAYGYPPERILEGPNWLEMDRFDVTAKMPVGTSMDAQKEMLQALLADRFGLVIKKENRPMTSYFLVAGKKPQMKQADGTGDTGCKAKSASGAPGEGGGIVMFGPAGRIALGPGGLLEYNCRNMTMADFAGGLQEMFGVGDLGQNPVKDETGLEGAWNFDVRWSIGFMGPLGQQGEHITVAEAIEKQMGLKLEGRQVPTPVIVVVSANRQPSPNPPGIAEALPPVKIPHEFEVADVKVSAPGGRGGMLRNAPGGRFTGETVAMQLLLMQAFSSGGGRMMAVQDSLVGIPEWAGMARYDISAKAPSVEGQPNVDQDAMGLMIRSLLEERFGLKWHTEERPLTAYTLTAVKPRMKKGDPKVRTSCKNVNAPAGSAPGSTTLVCQDITMEQFAERLPGMAPGMSWGVTDSTSLEGGWDFSLTFSRMGAMVAQTAAIGMGGRGGGGGGQIAISAGMAGAGVPMSADAGASEPMGSYTIFEAVEKQLGLKLVAQKRNVPVTVIDHLEQKPTEN